MLRNPLPPTTRDHQPANSHPLAGRTHVGQLHFYTLAPVPGGEGQGEGAFSNLSGRPSVEAPRLCLTPTCVRPAPPARAPQPHIRAYPRVYARILGAYPRISP